MSLILFRIDERLLHGQVIVGWGMRLGLDHYLIVDDSLSESDWESDLYSAGLPEDITVDFQSVTGTIAGFETLDGRPGRGALLTRGTREMRGLAETGLLSERRVNVGGLHAGENRTRALHYVYLRPEEADDLRAIGDHVRSVTARDLPDGREVQLQELLNAVV